MVDRETRAWDTLDAGLLVSCFHPDMVWPWPTSPHGHDPETWVFVMGRFNQQRWESGYREMFAERKLIHNVRTTAKILLSAEQDGALAVVDIDTLWELPDGSQDHWNGRVSKTYALMQNGEWKMTAHTGVLRYN
jgi:ketosteroid isomerase-like protein